MIAIVETKRGWITLSFITFVTVPFFHVRSRANFHFHQDGRTSVRATAKTNKDEHELTNKDATEH